MGKMSRPEYKKLKTKRDMQVKNKAILLIVLGLVGSFSFIMGLIWIFTKG